jgi:hypothetical protein
MAINKNIAISETGFLFNPSTGDSFSTNPIGQKVILWLQTGLSQDEIVANIQDEYSIDKDTAEKDIQDFFSLLKSSQIWKDEKQA